MHRYIIESREKLDILDILNAVGLILEPNRTHNPSTDTMQFDMKDGRFVRFRHSRLGLEISVDEPNFAD